VSGPDIDLLIPVHNAAATLEESLASVAHQTAAATRVVIVDDGSTDATPGLLAAWAARDPRIVVLTKANGGIVSALNAGLERCTAPYLARLDADDIAFPERLARQRAYLEANPRVVAVGCAVEHIDERGGRIAGLPQPGSPDAADPDRAPAREPYIIHPFLMARRAEVVRVGGYRHVPNSEDSDLYWRLAEVGGLHNLADVLGRYRVHQHSLSSVSIASGRIMAVGSQLGAVSARRRRSGKPDLRFEAGGHAALRAAVTLEAMSALAERQLEAGEVPRFRLAVAVKLLELAGYRPYRVEMSDCAFIRAALAHAHLFSGANRGEIRWHVTETAKRLLRRGRLAEAMALTPPSYYARSLAKALRG
jgi:GT2 family glycosyltransferase